LRRSAPSACRPCRSSGCGTAIALRLSARTDHRAAFFGRGAPSQSTDPACAAPLRYAGSMPVREVLPGVFHWTAVHPEIRVDVHCHYLEAQCTLLDPLVPEEGLAWFERRGPPRHVLLTNRLHSRASALFATRFGSDIWCNAEGLDHFGEGGELPGLEVHGFRAGDELFGGVQSLRIGELCPDETAFWIPGPEPALAIADGIVRNQ